MSGVVDTLEPPLFLIAMPQVGDPFFHRSLVLLLEHGEDGSFGLIVNRPTEILMQDLVDGLGVQWDGDPAALGWFGGPVQPGVGTMVWGHEELLEEENLASVEFAPGMRLSRDVGVLQRMAAAAPLRFRLFVGYAGWGSGQLEEELERNDWLLAPFDGELLFADDPEGSWKRALASIGVRPEALPTMTAPEDPEQSN
ncbi:MAG: YqgE/AlgH family protein [Thermoanaerobaculia bacterium]